MRKKPTEPGERRTANRYWVTMRMEIWPEFAERGSETKSVITRDISMHGIYFLSDSETSVGARINFRVLFRHQVTRHEEDLISGLGRVVRCDSVATPDEPLYGVAIEIENTIYLYEG